MSGLKVGDRGEGEALLKGKEFLIGGDTIALKLDSSDDWATWVVLNLNILATSKVNFKECELYLSKTKENKKEGTREKKREMERTNRDEVCRWGDTTHKIQNNQVGLWFPCVCGENSYGS